MPTVQLYGGQKVGTEALPGVRVSAAENADSAGVNLDLAKARTDEAIAGLGNAATGVAETALSDQRRIEKEQQDRADQIAVFDANNKLLQWKNSRLYSGDNAALAVKGQAAMPLPESVGDEFKTYADTLAPTMVTPRQKESFARLELEHQTDLDLTLRRHVYQEMTTYEGNVLQSTIDNNTADAALNANDPRRVSTAVGNIETAIKASGPRLGLPPEMVTDQITKAKSSAYTGVIMGLADQGDQKSATAWFQEAKAQGALEAPAIERIEKALKEGQVKKDSQTQADAIIAQGGSFTDQRNKAKAIDDPNVRDAVMTRIEHENAINDKAQEDLVKSTLNRAYATIDGGGKLDDIPASDRVTIAAHMPAVTEFALKKAKGEPIETDPATYYGLMQQAAVAPQSFATVNLLGARTKLSNADFKQVAEIQSAILKGDRETAEQTGLGGYRTIDQVIKNSLTQYGIPAEDAQQSTAQKASVAELHRLVDQEVSAREAAPAPPGQKKKKTTPDEAQQIVDKILGTPVTTPGSWWQSIPGMSMFSSPQKPSVVNLTIDDVPKSERTTIENRLRAAGQPVNDVTILNAYQTTIYLRGSK